MLISRQIIESLLPKFKNINNNTFIDACNAIGIEVEEIITNKKIDKVVIGKIIDVQKHPKSNKLSICKVKLSNNAEKTIVCGANNVQKNKKVVVANDGATLPNGLKISKRNILGVDSQGMLCGYCELAWSEPFKNIDTGGIIILDDSAIIGDSYWKYTGHNDEIYDLSIPSNRNDLNSIYPLCCELSGYFKWNKPTIIKSIKKICSSNKIIYDTSVCNGVGLVYLKDILIKESDYQLQKKLISCGINPINNIVDILNWITLLTNVPMHAYDSDQIEGSIHIVKNSGNCIFNGLNNKKFNLIKNDILVKDDKKIISLAGIIGSESTKITNVTKNVLIEIANFNNINIKNTASRLKISTDAAKRFSKPITIASSEFAMNLLINYFSKNVSKANCSFKKITKEKIKISWCSLSNFLGIKVNQKKIINGLKYFGFEYKDSSFFAPFYRYDILSEQDIYEEVLKIININNLKIEPICSTLLNNKNTEYLLISQIKSMMVNNYFNEVKTYNLTSEKKCNLTNLFNYKINNIISNASSIERKIFRKSLLNELLEVYKLNSSYKNELLPIFEIQQIYQCQDVYINLTGLLTNKIVLNDINGSIINIDLIYIKMLLEKISSLFNAKLNYSLIKNSNILYENESFEIKHKNEVIGYFGLLKESFIKKYELSTNKYYMFTINIDSLINNFQTKNIKFSQYSSLQNIYRDISIKINPSHLSKYITVINETNGVDKIKIIDIFNEKENKVSCTIRVLIKQNKQLSSNEINEIINDINERIKKVV